MLGKADVVHRVGNGQFHAAFFAQLFHRRRRHDALGELFELLPFDEHFPVHAVVRMAGKEGRFVIA